MLYFLKHLQDGFGFSGGLSCYQTSLFLEKEEPRRRSLNLRILAISPGASPASVANNAAVKLLLNLWVKTPVCAESPSTRQGTVPVHGESYSPFPTASLPPLSLLPSHTSLPSAVLG